MRAARALQEAFGLRSTVAVLGFALRTLAQQLDDGQLDELVAAQRAQRGSAPAGPRAAGGGERRGAGRPEGRSGAPVRGARTDPFARPSRPVAAPEPAPVLEEEPPAAEEPMVPADGAALEQAVEDLAQGEAASEQDA